jgi:hypothetical protein
LSMGATALGGCVAKGPGCGSGRVWVACVTDLWFTKRAMLPRLHRARAK